MIARRTLPGEEFAAEALQFFTQRVFELGLLRGGREEVSRGASIYRSQRDHTHCVSSARWRPATAGAHGRQHRCHLSIEEEGVRVAHLRHCFDPSFSKALAAQHCLWQTTNNADDVNFKRNCVYDEG